MSKVLEDVAINMLKEHNIIPEKTGKIYYGQDNFILPVYLNDKVYYFKFFTQPNKDTLEAEIKFTEFLRENGVNTPQYYKQGEKNIFEGEFKSFKTIFYASEHIDADIEPDMTPELLIDIIRNIAMMHKQTKKFDKTSINIEKETAYQKLMQYYVSKKDFWKEYGFTDIIEKVIEMGDEPKDTYPIHADLYTGNIMIENNKVKSFIDFGDIRESYFEDDLGKFFQNLLGAKGISIQGIKRLMSFYENETGYKLSRKNVYISTVYQILERFYVKTLEKENPKYTDKIAEILKDLEVELDKLREEPTLENNNSKEDVEER